MACADTVRSATTTRGLPASCKHLRNIRAVGIDSPTTRRLTRYQILYSSLLPTQLESPEDRVSNVNAFDEALVREKIHVLAARLPEGWELTSLGNHPKKLDSTCIYMCALTTSTRSPCRVLVCRTISRLILKVAGKKTKVARSMPIHHLHLPCRGQQHQVLRTRYLLPVARVSFGNMYNLVLQSQLPPSRAARR